MAENRTDVLGGCGGWRGNQHKKLASDQNDHLLDPKEKRVVFTFDTSELDAVLDEFKRGLDDLAEDLFDGLVVDLFDDLDLAPWDNTKQDKAKALG